MMTCCTRKNVCPDKIKCFLQPTASHFSCLSLINNFLAYLLCLPLQPKEILKTSSTKRMAQGDDIFSNCLFEISMILMTKMKTRLNQAADIKNLRGEC